MDFWRQMAKEILFYNYGIGADTVQAFISAMEEAKAEDVVVRVNSPGGNPFFGWGAVAKFKEHTEGKKIKVDGAAQSMAAYFLLFCDDVEALDVSNILFHRAHMNIYSTEDQNYLDQINANLRKKLEAKVDAAKWKEVTGISIKEMFEGENRIDVSLNAKQAKQLGIVTKIVTLKPDELTAFNERFSGVAAKIENTENINKNTMTKEEFKAKHPDVYASIVKEGTDSERDRVGSHLAFLKADPEAVVKGIKEGKALSATDMAELSVKMMSANSLEKIETESADAVVTAEVKDKGADAAAKTKEQKEIAEFEKKVDAHLNLTPAAQK